MEPVRTRGVEHGDQCASCRTVREKKTRASVSTKSSAEAVRKATAHCHIATMTAPSRTLKARPASKHPNGPSPDGKSVMESHPYSDEGKSVTESHPYPAALNEVHVTTCGSGPVVKLDQMRQTVQR